MKLHWIPLTLDEKYLNDVLASGKKFSAHAMQLSHTILHNVDDILNDELHLSRVQWFQEKASFAGYETWCWTHEILNPPAACITNNILNLEHPSLPLFLQEKYQLFLQKLLPNLTGLILTFAETQFEVYKDNTVILTNLDNNTPLYKTQILVHHIFDVAQKNNVSLFIRDFVYRKHEIQDMLQVIFALDNRIGVMSKCVPHDWQPFYPDNEVIGAVHPKDQWVEFDLGHEYELQGVVPYATPEALFARAKHFATLDIDTACLRLDRYDADKGTSAIYTPWGQLELLVFSSIAKQNTCTIDSILQEWELTQFKGALEIITLSTNIVHRMLFPHKLWIANHSNLPDYDYAKSHLKDGNADRLPTWTNSAEDIQNTILCDCPTQAFYDEILQENDDCLTDYKKIEDILSEQKIILAEHPLWENGLHRLKDWLLVWNAYKSAYFALRVYETNPDEILPCSVSEKITVLETICNQFAHTHQNDFLSGKQVSASHTAVIQSLKKQLEKDTS